MAFTPEQQRIFSELAAATAHEMMKKLFQMFPWMAQAVVAPHTVNRGNGPEMVTNPQLLAEIADNLNDLNNNIEVLIDVEVSLGERALPRKEAKIIMDMVDRRRRANRRKSRGC